MTLIEKLRSQIGDDIQHVFDHEVLFRLAAARIEELEAKLREAAMQSLSDLWQAQDAWDRAMAAEAKLATDRNDALEEAAIAAEVWYRNLGKGTPHDEIRALKSTNQTGKENE